MRTIVWFLISLSVNIYLNCAANKLLIKDNCAYYSNDDMVTSIEAGSNDNNSKPPKVINMKPPKYPSLAAKNGVSGTVRLAVLIMSDGRVKRSKIIASSDPIFNRAALSAAMKWKFEPADLNGLKFNAWIEAPVTFHR